MADLNSEEQRILDVYAKRDQAGKPALYAWYWPDVLLGQYRLRQVVADMLPKEAFADFSRIHALDVGCGAGGWLRWLQDLGADPSNLHGIDLLEDRIKEGRRRSPHLDLRVASAWPIPEDIGVGKMDLVTAHTVFSSILDADGRENLAREMVRFLAPKGIIMIYDYRISDPKNPDTIGIGLKEIRRIFGDMHLKSRTLTLAPPISRRIAGRFPLFALWLEKVFPFLRTHRVYALSHKDGRP